MALSEFYESTILEVNASFGFHSFPCAPEAITERIGLQPDKTSTKDHPHRIGSDGQRILVPFSSWSIFSSSPSKDINEHLRQLLVRLGTAKLPFDPSWGEPHFGVLWKCSYLYAGTGPFYEPDVVTGIAAFTASLYQDIYQVDEANDEE